LHLRARSRLTLTILYLNCVKIEPFIEFNRYYHHIECGERNGEIRGEAVLHNVDTAVFMKLKWRKWLRGKCDDEPEAL
jgi:hypothetical protein